MCAGIVSHASQLEDWYSCFEFWGTQLKLLPAINTEDLSIICG